MSEFKCRLCGSTSNMEVLTLSDMPITHHLRQSTMDEPILVDLNFAQCSQCGLLQLSNSIPSDVLYFQANSYLTGFQSPKHIDDLLISAKALSDPGSALDIGCNDGSLLSKLKEHGYKNLAGIEPVKTAAKIARSKGFDIHNKLFSYEFSRKLIETSGEFGLVTCRHIVEHIDDLEDFFDGIKLLLAEKGLLLVEVPKVEDCLSSGNPAILWEEHVSYFTQNQMQALLEQFGFRVVAKREYAFGGGSYAYICQKDDSLIPANNYNIIQSEASDLVRQFKKQHSSYKRGLENLLYLAKDKDWDIVLYGAAPRSCIVLNSLSLMNYVDFVLDDRNDIQNYLIPGGDQIITGLERYSPNRQNVLCLMGVGAENEYKIKAKLKKHVSGHFISASLFAPRDSISTFEEASRLITDKTS